MEGADANQVRRLTVAYEDFVKAQGPLSGTQLAHLARLEGYAPTQAQLEPWQDKEGISCDDFVGFCKDIGYEDPSFEELASFFVQFDPDNSGRISKKAEDLGCLCAGPGLPSHHDLFGRSV
mmetsp:Transcript_61204/g.96881  ORF Transcript_61204/g.96881 Transcript_61204/m.96881 type:complete len:121 (+) Transcript_61204:57-419(+)